MVNLSSLGIGTSANNTLNKDVIRNIEKEEAISGNTRGSKCIRLSRSARESIKKPSARLAIGLVKTILDLFMVYLSTKVSENRLT